MVGPREGDGSLIDARLVALASINLGAWLLPLQMGKRVSERATRGGEGRNTAVRGGLSAIPQLTPQWFLSGSALLPQWTCTSSAVALHFFRSGSAVVPHCFRSGSSLLIRSGSSLLPQWFLTADPQWFLTASAVVPRC